MNRELQFINHQADIVMKLIRRLLHLDRGDGFETIY
ncbi:MAG: Uncharacterised protein [Hyphomonas sp. TMED17]|nr:MAG: Uncharacterised protein [Hyphomonas sp. TMED17]